MPSPRDEPVSFDFDTAWERLPARMHDRMGGRASHLVIVCSPRRHVGKTLLARLLVEFHVADGKPVVAHDLADEGPQLADFLPGLTAMAEVGSIRGQMALFDGLLGDRDAAQIVDVSHRTFGAFFTVAHKIGFFEEARRRAIEPVILFLPDPHPKSAEAYAMLRRWFPGTSLLPVRNQSVAKGIPYDAFLNHSDVHIALELPLLASSSLKVVVDAPSFSFARFDHSRNPDKSSTPGWLPPRLDDELRGWLKRIFRQFRELDLWLMQRQILTLLN
jgi:hypothetical protein